MSIRYIHYIERVCHLIVTQGNIQFWDPVVALHAGVPGYCYSESLELLGLNTSFGYPSGVNEIVGGSPINQNSYSVTLHYSPDPECMEPRYSRQCSNDSLWCITLV